MTALAAVEKLQWALGNRPNSLELRLENAGHANLRSQNHGSQGMAKICHRRALKKSPWFWVTVVTVWLLLIVTIQGPLITLLIAKLSLLQRLSLALFLAWIDFAWLHAIYIAAALCFQPTNLEASATAYLSEGTPAIALLYTTMNDFSEKAALSCVNQNYPTFHVYLLDDSCVPHYKSRVDQFNESFPRATTVVRRENREGFKAGNLNHALRLVAHEYEFFAVCDADGVLPPDFLTRMLPHFSDDKVGFVQACQRPVLPNDASRFAADLIVGGQIYWERLFSHAARYGFVMFHGHGGVIRTKVWQEAGGFPLVVSEDLEFSTRIRRLGYSGIIADDVVCDEDFPPSHSAFCKRQLKYLRGTCEHLKRDMLLFLCSLRIPWFEKADRLLASLTMISAPLFVAFLIDLLVLLPLAFPSETHSVVQSEAIGIQPFGLRLAPSVFKLIANVPFYSMTVAGIFLPSLPAVLHLWKEPKRLVRYMACCAAVYLSLVFRQAWDMLVVMVSGRNFFPVTGAKSKGTAIRGLRQLNRDTLLFTIDVIALTALIIVGLLSNGFVLIAPCCVAVGLGLVVDCVGWDHPLVRKTLFLPFAVTIVSSGAGFIALL